MLNAKHHEREATIVAQAGRSGAITIATNMAGRGTDILLGGNPEVMAKDALAEEKAKVAEEAAKASSRACPRRGTSTGDGADPYRGVEQPAFDEDERYKELLAQLQGAVRGRARGGARRRRPQSSAPSATSRAASTTSCAAAPVARATPAASRFYLSLEDDLLRIFGLDRMTGLMERLGLEEDVPIEHRWSTRSIENAQKKVEGHNFDQRKNLLEYDDVMNQQRKTIYALRRQILDGRYHREPTEDEEKQGIVPEPVTSSGNWTVDLLMPEVEPRLGQMIDLRRRLRRRPRRQASARRGRRRYATSVGACCARRSGVSSGRCSISRSPTTCHAPSCSSCAPRACAPR